MNDAKNHTHTGAGTFVNNKILVQLKMSWLFVLMGTAAAAAAVVVVCSLVFHVSDRQKNEKLAETFKG